VVNFFKKYLILFFKGKSTLFQLLLKFYDVEKGEILIDDVNIKNMSVNHLRSLFGVVSQEPVLFVGTVAFNIKFFLH